MDKLIKMLVVSAICVTSAAQANEGTTNARPYEKLDQGVSNLTITQSESVSDLVKRNKYDLNEVEDQLNSNAVQNSRNQNNIYSNDRDIADLYRRVNRL
ncbi:hypothetical protein [Vibrio crassostreae]|uniref:hypothetical protein n=1 Tax=Vibrio crassostreae TaxID=246167 RepID=UPI001B317EC2|nr:hypothetical protein [Vibrio crassostreae]